MNIKKEVVVFEEHNSFVIACVLSYDKRENFVKYFIFDALEESSLFDMDLVEGSYNLLGPSGVVDSFEDATQLAAGKIFISNDPTSIINGRIINYSVTFDGHRPFLAHQIESMVEIIKTRLQEYASKIIAGEELDNEFVFIKDGERA